MAQGKVREELSANDDAPPKHTYSPPSITASDSPVETMIDEMPSV